MKLLVIGCILMVVSASIQHKKHSILDRPELQNHHVYNGVPVGTSVVQQAKVEDEVRDIGLDETVISIDSSNVAPIGHSNYQPNGIGRPVFHYPHGYNSVQVETPVVQAKDGIGNNEQVETVKPVDSSDISPVLQTQYPQGSYYVIRRPMLQFHQGPNTFTVGTSAVQHINPENEAHNVDTAESVKPVDTTNVSPVVHPQDTYYVVRRPVFQYHQRPNRFPIGFPTEPQYENPNNVQIETVKPEDSSNVAHSQNPQDSYHGIGRPNFQYHHGINGLPIETRAVQQATAQDEALNKAHVNTVKHVDSSKVAPLVYTQQPQDSYYGIGRPVFQYNQGFNRLAVETPAMQRPEAHHQQIESAKPVVPSYVVHSQHPQDSVNGLRGIIFQHNQIPVITPNDVPIENTIGQQATAFAKADKNQEVKTVKSAVSSDQREYSIPLVDTRYENPVVPTYTKETPVLEVKPTPVLQVDSKPVETVKVEQANIKSFITPEVQHHLTPSDRVISTYQQHFPVVGSSEIPVDATQVHDTKVYSKPVTAPILTPAVQSKVFPGHPLQISYTTQHVVPSLSKVDETGKVKSSKPNYPYSYSYLYRVKRDVLTTPTYNILSYQY